VKLWQWALGGAGVLWLLRRNTVRTEHFSPDEWKQRAGYGVPAYDYPAEWIQDRWLPLADILEKLRAKLGKSIKIVSGYRSKAYNTQLYLIRYGKAPTDSQHSYGRAADIVVSGVPAATVHALLLKMHNNGEIKLGGLGSYSSFTHIDVRPGNTLARWNG
jgi:hypothetical protein